MGSDRRRLVSAPSSLSPERARESSASAFENPATRSFLSSGRRPPPPLRSLDWLTKYRTLFTLRPSLTHRDPASSSGRDPLSVLPGAEGPSSSLSPSKGLPSLARAMSSRHALRMAEGTVALRAWKMSLMFMGRKESRIMSKMALLARSLDTMTLAPLPPALSAASCHFLCMARAVVLKGADCLGLVFSLVLDLESLVSLREQKLPSASLGGSGCFRLVFSLPSVLVEMVSLRRQGLPSSSDFLALAPFSDNFRLALLSLEIDLEGAVFPMIYGCRGVVKTEVLQWLNGRRGWQSRKEQPTCRPRDTRARECERSEAWVCGLPLPGRLSVSGSRSARKKRNFRRYLFTASS